MSRANFKIWIWAGILLAQIVLFYLLSTSATALEAAAVLFKWKAQASQKLFSEFVFSAGDIVYAFLALSLLVMVSAILINAKNKKPLLSSLMIALNISYFLYQIIWGMMYFQPPVTLLSDRKHTLEETREIATILLKRCQAARNSVKEDQNGVFKIYNQKMVEKEIIKQQRYLPKTFPNKDFSTGINTFKPSLFSGLMSTTGILGYYNPLTSEAQYNPNVPSSLLPFTLAHESAHQLGYAREQEANFIGYILGNDSQSADLRYSTQLYALRSILNAIYPTDSLFVKKMILQYSPGMARDRAFEKAFAKMNFGITAEVFSLANDMFLKSNRQDGAITYSYFTDLLIKYELKQKNRVSQRDSKNTNDENNFMPCADCSVTKRVKDITKTTN